MKNNLLLQILCFPNYSLRLKKCRCRYPTPAQYKKEFVWLKEVDSLALANAQINLNKAYKNFFRDKSVGFPKFKKKKARQSYTTNNQNGTIYMIPKLMKKKTMIKNNKKTPNSVFLFCILFLYMPICRQANKILIK